jgi:H+-transporting ATPase
LVLAAESTQVFATVIAAVGILMAPLGWGLAGLVWGYALLEFIITDFLKVHYFRLFENGKRKIAANLTPPPSTLPNQN